MKLIVRIIKKIGRILRPILLTTYNVFQYFDFAKKKADKKIVLVSHDSSRTGAPSLLLNIAKRLNNQGYTVFIISLLGGKLKKDFKDNSYRSIFYPSRLLFSFLKHSRFNILINTVVAASRIKSIKGKNNYVVSLIHEMPDIISDLLLIKQKTLNKITSLSDIIVFPSKYNLDIFEEKFGVINIDKRIMPQGLYKTNKVDISKEEAKQRVCERYGIDKDASIYISCAFISKIKGYDFFYSLASDYTYKKKVHFVWAGTSTSYFEEFKKERGFDSLPNNLTNLGFISNPDELSELYMACDYFLMLSRQETFPSTILEAFSLGKPVIAFDKCGGYVEIMNQDNGYIVPPYELDQIVEIINNTSPDDDKYKKMSTNCKKLIKESFDFDKYINNIIHLFPLEKK